MTLQKLEIKIHAGGRPQGRHSLSNYPARNAKSFNSLVSLGVTSELAWSLVVDPRTEHKIIGGEIGRVALVSIKIVWAY